ncbi:hypothetical protein ES705_18499 [subsurface metagenome]
MNLVTFLKKNFFFAIVLPFVFSIACKNQTGSQDKWQYLFDGKTLNGWKILGGKADFYVEDGMIVCNTKLDIDGGLLVTKKLYDNFILELDVKIDTSLNSGVQCRSQMWEKDTTTTYLAGDSKGTIHQSRWKAGSVWGYQIEVDPSDRAWSGGLYEPGNRGWVVTLADNEAARKSFKPMDWNHFKIIMDGNKIQTWVNGVIAVDTTDDMSASGFLGFQFHKAYRKWQVDKKVFWKNIKIKEL